jgi:hypothetical protein
MRKIGKFTVKVVVGTFLLLAAHAMVKDAVDEAFKEARVK